MTPSNLLQVLLSAWSAVRAGTKRFTSPRAAEPAVLPHLRQRFAYRTARRDAGCWTLARDGARPSRPRRLRTRAPAYRR